MFLCRFNNNRLGVHSEGVIRDVTSVLESLPSYRYPFPLGDIFVEALPGLKDKILAAQASAPEISASEVRFLSPVANPSKLVAAPVNYKKHRAEVAADANLHHGNAAHIMPIQEIGLFLKANSSLVGASEGITLRHPGRRTDHEVELAVIIGRAASFVPAKDALKYIAGYSIGLDITVRGSEDRSFRKSIDTYSVLGPWMVTADELPDPSQLELSIEVNGEVRQQANTRDLILGVPELIEFASSFYTLLPGDILYTGTPEGVGPIQPGDHLRAKIEKIGELHVDVRSR